MPTKFPYKCEIRPNGTINKNSIYGSFRNKTKLKEVYIVRYADDFKLFCRNKEDANKIFIATEKWLKNRLKLEISSEKSKIVNLKRQYSEFLGFKFKAIKKRHTYVVRSHIIDKAKEIQKNKLIEQLKKIAHTKNREEEVREIAQYNAMVIGMHNYYKYATMIAKDCDSLHRNVSIVIYNRLRHRISRKGKINEPYIRENYGKSKQIRFIGTKVVCPIGYVQTKTPMFKRKIICKYTKIGREAIHKNLKYNVQTMLSLMRINEKRRSIEYMDNRISLYVAQHGKCAITGKCLSINEIHCHHKLPISKGGTDEYTNLIILDTEIHKLVHKTEINENLPLYKTIKANETSLAKFKQLQKMCILK